MNRSIHRISLDIHKVGSQTALNVKKGDTARSICITLTENGRPYEIHEECSAVFSAKKPDGNFILNDCVIQGNEIVYDFTPQTAPVAGAMECEVSLYDKAGNQITSPRFLIVVDEVVYNDEDIVSSNEANALKALIVETSEATANAQEAIALATEATSNSKEAAALAVEATEGADRSAKLASDAADTANKAAASASGVKEEMHELLGRKPLNLLDSNNIKRWDVVHQSSAAPYSMYAGAVDLTDCELDGITGVLSLAKTNGTDANYVDFNYRNTVNLGDEFSILLTAFIKSNIKNDGTNNPTDDSYVKLDLGDCSIELVRKAADASSEAAWNRCNFRVGVSYHYDIADGTPVVEPAHYSDLIPADITTALYNGKPTTEAKLGTGGVAITKIKSNSLGTSGSKLPVVLDYQKDSGWKDLLISYKGGVLKVEDCKGNVLYTAALPSEMSFENVKPKVRIYSDPILMKNHTLDVFRLEMSSDYINKIHEHENKDILDTITQEVVETAVEFKAHQSDTNNPHQVTTEQIGTLSKEEIVEKIDKASKGELNLLDSEHIKKWNIVRQSDNPDTPADTPYNHYAGAVDMTGQGIEGVTGMLSQLQTNSFTTQWTDFVYDGTVDLGTNFSMLITAFIHNYDTHPKIPYDDSYVEIQFGMFSIRLVRKLSDMETGYDFHKLRLALCGMGNPITYTDIITSKEDYYVDGKQWYDYDTYPTTTLYDGQPATNSPLGQPDSSVLDYIRSKCPAQNGHTLGVEGARAFTRNHGWKDFTIKLKNGVLSVIDANGNPFKFMNYADGTFSAEEINLFDFGVTTDAFYNLTPKVRMFHETGVSVYHPHAVVRLELKVADGGCYMEPLSELQKSVEDLQASVTNIYDITNGMGTAISNLDTGVSNANSTAEGAVNTVNSFVEEYGPKMDTYATEIFVTTKIAEAQLSGGDVDLSGYATTEQLNEVDGKASQAISRSGSAADDAASALDEIRLLYGRVETLESKEVDLSGYATAQSVVEATSQASAALDEAGNAMSRAEEAHSMASTTLEEVGEVGDFATAFYFAGEVLTDTLLIYVGTIDNKTHFKSYIVNSSTTNVPVADNTFKGVRHPINILRHSADNIDYVVKITELTPVLGRQWINYYSTDSGSWHGWTEV